MHVDAWSADLPDRLQRWLGQLLDNLKAIVAHLPEAESYAVTAGLPDGSQRHGHLHRTHGNGPGS